MANPLARVDHTHKRNMKRRCKRWGVPRIGDYRASEVFARDGWRCHWCGCSLDPSLLGQGGTDPKAPTVDHLLPLSRGGWDCAANVVASCAECNRARAGALPLMLEAAR